MNRRKFKQDILVEKHRRALVFGLENGQSFNFIEKVKKLDLLLRDKSSSDFGDWFIFGKGPSIKGLGKFYQGAIVRVDDAQTLDFDRVRVGRRETGFTGYPTWHDINRLIKKLESHTYWFIERCVDKHKENWKISICQHQLLSRGHDVSNLAQS